MPNPFVVQGPMLRELVQGLLEMKKMARSIENSADAFLPLTDDETTRLQLSVIANHCQHIVGELNPLYESVAREAAQV